MTKILFVCHGNICRSPMAEFIMRDLIEKKGLSDLIYTASAATSNEEIGNPVYPPIRHLLEKRGISCNGKLAQRVTKADYTNYDILICMDSANVKNLKKITGGDPDGKMHKLLSFTGECRNVADPWYTGDFSAAERDIEAGCEALLNYIKEKDGL